MKARILSSVFGVGRMVIKPHAHLTTLVAIPWTFFSIGAFYFLGCFRHGEGLANLLLAIGVWAVHVALISLASYFWITEKKRKVTVLKTSGDFGGD